MSEVERLRGLFKIDDAIVSALSDTAVATERWKEQAKSRGLQFHPTPGTVTEELWSWKEYARSQGMRFGVEYLLPRIRQEIRGEWPAFTQRRLGHLDLSADELRMLVTKLRPWTIPYQLADGINTGQAPHSEASHAGVERLLFRRDLISNTVATLLGSGIGDATVLDIGCQNGFFSMDLAERGVGQVTGIDLRPNNIAQAQFLKEYFGVEHVDFVVSDADALAADFQADVVLNLGILYHVVNPLPFIRQTYELCRRFAIIDTVTHREPISGYFILGERDVNNPGEGRESFELHPTYRGLIDTIRYAGFRDIFEIVGDTDTAPELYDTGQRRCLLAVK